VHTPPPAATIAAAAASLLAVMPCEAIVRRHDRDDERYIAYARELTLAPIVDVGDATGTLVGPRWVLTAGHVASSISAATRTVTVAGQPRVVDKVIFHPAWIDGPGPDVPDLALLRLTEPVDGVTPMPLYESGDEVGRQVIFAGRGMIGTGQTGPTGEDRILRAATNIVSGTPWPGWMTFEFDAPPDGTELEGISGPGDSGGPAMIDVDGVLHLAGVSGANDSHGHGPCRYGSTEYYARVSTNAEWIGSVLRDGDRVPADEWPQLLFVADTPLPDTPAGRVAAAFFLHYADGSPARMAEFERAWRAESALAERSVEQRVETWPQYRQRFGDQVPLAFVDDGATLRLDVVGCPDGDGQCHSFRFECEPDEPHKLVGILIAPVPRPHRP